MSIKIRAYIHRTDLGTYDFEVDTLDEVESELENIPADEISWDIYALDEEIVRLKNLDTGKDLNIDD